MVPCIANPSPLFIYAPTQASVRGPPLSRQAYEILESSILAKDFGNSEDISRFWERFQDLADFGRDSRISENLWRDF